LDVKKRKCCTSFWRNNKRISKQCILSARTCPIKKFRKCRIVKRGRCHRNVCCSSERKNNRLIKKKKCYNAGKLLCGKRRFVRKCSFRNKRVVCCTRGYLRGVKTHHKCKSFLRLKKKIY